LNNKENTRHNALQKSALDLETDKREVIEFVQEQNLKKQRSEEREKQLLKEKHELDERIRNNESAAAQMKSEIEKNTEHLISLLAYKQFVMMLTPAEEKDPFIKRQAQQRTAFKQTWVEQIKSARVIGTTDYDSIIFDESELLGDDAKELKTAFERRTEETSNAGLPPLNKKAVSQLVLTVQTIGKKPPLHRHSLAEKRKLVSHEGWEKIYDILFRKHMIFDMPTACFAEELFFKDSQDLDQKFDFLEG
jgi:hypothetical protein